ncbi:hypothetical protein C8Q77DRAFT_863745 [Trametes polyzona]|nr:hypothetical protein C8Q77DRAFT_863745 [Trametes polyzona]
MLLSRLLVLVVSVWTLLYYPITPASGSTESMLEACICRVCVCGPDSHLPTHHADGYRTSLHRFGTRSGSGQSRCMEFLLVAEVHHANTA